MSTIQSICPVRSQPVIRVSAKKIPNLDLVAQKHCLFKCKRNLKCASLTWYIENKMYVSFDISFIRRDQKQRRNGETHVFLVEPD